MLAIPLAQMCLGSACGSTSMARWSGVALQAKVFCLLAVMIVWPSSVVNWGLLGVDGRV